MMYHHSHTTAQQLLQQRRVLGTPTQTLYSSRGTTFEIGRSLGTGGMSQVHLALRRNGDRSTQTSIVALKLLHHNAPTQAQRLFYHEGALLPRLHHPHLIQFVERGRGAIPGVGHIDYLATQYIGGETAEQLVTRLGNPLSGGVVLHVITHIASALNYLHQRGIVHCDIKPGNIMICPAAPYSVLIDLGIARSLDFRSCPVAVGTPQYMAPEQVRATQPCDGRTDLYALGIVIYELLAGRRLFPGRTTTSIREQPLAAPSIDDLKATLPYAVADVVVRCLQPDPNERYPTVALLFDAFQYAMQSSFVDAKHLPATELS